MENLRFVRELYGISQGDVAAALGTPQPTYAKYELGKVQKIPFGFMSKFAHHYRIDERWLAGNPDPLDEIWQRDLKLLEEKLHSRCPEIAETFRLPIAFVEAVVTGKVIAAREFYRTVAKHYKLTIEDTLKDIEHRNKVYALENEIKALRADIANRDITINHLNAHISLLSDELKVRRSG